MTADLKPWPYLQQPEQAQAVRDAQHLLRGHGYALVVDGIFGPVTNSTVRTFQKEHGLAVDGIIGPDTWPQLIIQVAEGDRGDAVRAAQEELRIRAAVGNPDLDVAIDGIFGPRTDAAVRAFQDGVSRAVPSFPVDGIVGTLTWQALIGGMLAD